ncbi:hypothetical protein Acsp02_56170 [Actinoplanes sp. NBRC 103695]|nr:hypothetical protein Acsp02_56170 [Actinoplanes sp. NBRC 103695]
MLACREQVADLVHLVACLVRVRVAPGGEVEAGNRSQLEEFDDRDLLQFSGRGAVDHGAAEGRKQVEAGLKNRSTDRVEHDVDTTWGGCADLVGQSGCEWSMATSAPGGMP